MREKVKTAALLILILVSFQLTSMFWMRSRAPLSSALSQIPASPTSEIPQGSYLDLYAPLFIYVHDGGSHFQLRVPDSEYQQVWQKLKGAITGGMVPTGDQSVELLPANADAWQQAISNSLEFRFSGQVELNYWWLAASKSTFQKFPSEPLFFDRMLVPLNDSSVYFCNLQTGNVWRWQWSSQLNAALFPGVANLPFSNSQRLREVQAPNGVAVAPLASLFVERRLTTLPEVLATLPYSEADRTGIVKQFLGITPRMPKTDVSADGEVVESYITAKQQVLRLHNTGLIEFTETVKQPAAAWASVTEQFEQAFNFIGTHGGWPETVISAGIKQVGMSGYQFDFMQLYEGYPLVDLTPANISVRVTPEGIKSYIRKVYHVEQNGYFRYEVRSAEDALTIAGSKLAGRKVTDIYLGYYQRNDVAFDSEQPFNSEPMYLFPVWVVELNDGQQLLVHAFKLMNDPGVIVAE